MAPVSERSVVKAVNLLKVCSPLLFITLALACRHNEEPPAGFPGRAVEALCADGQLRLSGNAVVPSVPSNEIDPLPCGNSSSESYQFDVFSALSASLHALRVWRTGDEVEMQVVKKDRQNQVVTREKATKVSAEDWALLSKAIADCNFWAQPSTVERQGDSDAHTDGESVTVEGYFDGRYHSVTRSSGDRALAGLHAAFLRLRDLSRR